MGGLDDYLWIRKEIIRKYSQPASRIGRVIVSGRHGKPFNTDALVVSFNAGMFTILETKELTKDGPLPQGGSSWFLQVLET